MLGHCFWTDSYLLKYTGIPKESRWNMLQCAKTGSISARHLHCFYEDHFWSGALPKPFKLGAVAGICTWKFWSFKGVTTSFVESLNWMTQPGPHYGIVLPAADQHSRVREHAGLKDVVNNKSPPITKTLPATNTGKLFTTCKWKHYHSKRNCNRML